MPPDRGGGLRVLKQRLFQSDASGLVGSGDPPRKTLWGGRVGYVGDRWNQVLVLPKDLTRGNYGQVLRRLSSGIRRPVRLRLHDAHARRRKARHGRLLSNSQRTACRGSVSGDPRAHALRQGLGTQRYQGQVLCSTGLRLRHSGRSWPLQVGRRVVRLRQGGARRLRHRGVARGPALERRQDRDDGRLLRGAATSRPWPR